MEGTSYAPNSFDPTIVTCLQNYSEDFVKHSDQALIALDRARDLDLNGLVHMLEWFHHTSYPRLFTGSRRYSQMRVRPDSDFDWVLKIPNSREYHDGLAGAADSQFDLGEEYIPKGTVATRLPAIDVSYRFGPVNLICVSTIEQWVCWTEGTKRLVDCVMPDYLRGFRTNVPRDLAIKVFNSLRELHLLPTHDDYS